MAWGTRNLISTQVHWRRIDKDALVVVVDVKLPYPGGSTAYYDAVGQCNVLIAKAIQDAGAELCLPTSRRVDPPVVSRSNDACTDGARRRRRLPRRLSTPAWAPPPPRATSRASREMCRPPARERAASP